MRNVAEYGQSRPQTLGSTESFSHFFFLEFSHYLFRHVNNELRQKGGHLMSTGHYENLVLFKDSHIDCIRHLQVQNVGQTGANEFSMGRIFQSQFWKARLVI